MDRLRPLGLLKATITLMDIPVKMAHVLMGITEQIRMTAQGTIGLAQVIETPSLEKKVLDSSLLIDSA